jgi:hypothetical protein
VAEGLFWVALPLYLGLAGAPACGIWAVLMAAR